MIWIGLDGQEIRTATSFQNNCHLGIMTLLSTHFCFIFIGLAPFDHSAYFSLYFALHFDCLQMMSGGAAAANGIAAAGPVSDDADLKQLRGHLLVEAIFTKYGAGTMTLPWFNKGTGERNIKPDPVNRPIMESLAEAYSDRILDSGLNVDCSGGVGEIWLD